MMISNELIFMLHRIRHHFQTTFHKYPEKPNKKINSRWVDIPTYR